jgi:hypothetical protein
VICRRVDITKFISELGSMCLCSLKKIVDPFFELVKSNMGGIQKFEKTRIRKTPLHVHRFKFAGEW